MSDATEYVGKSALVAANKRRYRDVDVPCLGTVRIRSLTERERSGYEASFLDRDGNPTRGVAGAKARLIALCVCDKEGRRIFTDDESAVLGDVDCVITNTLADAIKEHCGFTKSDIEELEKN